MAPLWVAQFCNNMSKSLPIQSLGLAIIKNILTFNNILFFSCARRILRVKASLSKPGNHSARAMPGAEKKIQHFKICPKKNLKCEYLVYKVYSLLRTNQILVEQTQYLEKLTYLFIHFIPLLQSVQLWAFTATNGCLKSFVISFL